jgi:hypothetical protein
VARKRFVTSEISTDRKIAKLAEKNPTAAALWPWFITAFDDWGRMNADPIEVKLTIFPAFPYTSDEVEEFIKLYHEFEIAYFYEVDEKPYLAVNPETWLKYQTYIRKDKLEKQKSKIPEPKDAPWVAKNDTVDDLATKNVAKQQSATENVLSPSPSPSPSPSMNVKAVRGSGGETESQQPAAPITDYERNCLNVLKSVKDYPFDFEKDLDMTRTFMVEFPMLDIYAEYKRWREYKRDRPLKNRSSPRLQLRNWMEKGQKFLIEQGVRSNDGASPRGSRAHKGRTGSTASKLESIVIDGAGNEASSAG